MASRLVVSLTTIPSRIGSIETTLRSLTVGQTRPPDCVYLGLPMRSARDGETLDYSIPTFLSNPKAFGGLVRIVPLEYDYGPVCKILAGLTMEPEPDTRIVVCDDDLEYGRTWLAELEAHGIKHPTAAVGFGGFDVLRRPPFFRMRFGGVGPGRPWLPPCNEISPASLPRRVDCLMGVTGALYRRGHFTDEGVAQLHAWSKDPTMRRTDDVLISASISTRGVPRVLVRPSDAAERASRDLAGPNPLSASFARAASNHVYAFSTLQASAGAFDDSPDMRWGGLDVRVCWVILFVVFVLLCFFTVRLLRTISRHTPPSFASPLSTSKV